VSISDAQIQRCSAIKPADLRAGRSSSDQYNESIKTFLSVLFTYFESALYNPE